MTPAERATLQADVERMESQLWAYRERMREAGAADDLAVLRDIAGRAAVIQEMLGRALRRLRGKDP
jgi:hypothetical protein